MTQPPLRTAREMPCTSRRALPIAAREHVPYHSLLGIVLTILKTKRKSLFLVRADSNTDISKFLSKATAILLKLGIHFLYFVKFCAANELTKMKNEFTNSFQAVSKDHFVGCALRIRIDLRFICFLFVQYLF